MAQAGVKVRVLDVGNNEQQGIMVRGVPYKPGAEVVVSKQEASEMTTSAAKPLVEVVSESASMPSPYDDDLDC